MGKWYDGILQLQSSIISKQCVFLFSKTKYYNFLGIHKTFICILRTILNKYPAVFQFMYLNITQYSNKCQDS